MDNNDRGKTLNYQPKPSSARRRADRAKTDLKAALRVMLSRTARRIVMGIFLLAVAVVIVGYTSAYCSKRRCETVFAKSFFASAGRNYYVLAGPGEKQTREILQSASIKFNTMPANSPAPLMPWIEIGHARIVEPFAVEVPYRWLDEPEFGAGGSERYFCWFGHIVHIGPGPVGVNY